MNSKIALAVIAVLLTSQGAFANRQGGTNNATRNGKANATSGAVVRNGTAVNARAKAAANGANSGDAAAAAAASAFGRKQPVAVKPAVRVEVARPARVAKSANAAPTVAKEVSETVAAISKSGLDGKLNGRIAELTSVLSKNPQLLAVAKEVVATHKTHPQLIKLSEARIEGLIYISKLPADLQDLSTEPSTPNEISTEAYVALVINAGREAANWQATTQDNMVEMITTANQTLASSNANSSMAKPSDVAAACGAAFDAAAAEVSKNKKEKITAADVRRLCGKA